MADFVFSDVSIVPNPVNTEADYKISVQMIDKVHGILTKDDFLIMTKDGKAIERKEA